MISRSRLNFAARYAGRHLLISLLIALTSAAVVFGLWYLSLYRQLLQVEHIYLLVLAVDVVCGPLLTLVLASPKKSRRERWLDFSLIGVIQLAALAYGMHSVWVARPVALVFEVDRLVVVTANELQLDALPKAPPGLRQLPWAGVLKAGTRKAASNEEFMRNVERGLAGFSTAMQPDWWTPWSDAGAAMRARAKPLAELIARRPQAAQKLQDAARSTGHAVAGLRYMPLVSSKTLDWVALLDAQMNMVGWAPVDGF
ncbi:MAG: fimb protein [Proteobacteria bacterium]|nr:fimb protein [Pseudomonadota bacterium]